MATKRINVQRVSIVSLKPFEAVVAKFEAAIGHPNMKTLFGDIGSVETYAEMEKAIHKATGPSDLMEFIRFDLGEILRKETGKKTPKSLRFLVGNPLIMKQMAVHVSDAGSYAPVTIWSTSGRMECTSPAIGWPASWRLAEVLKP